MKDSELTKYKDHARNVFFGFCKMPSAGARARSDAANRVLTRAFAEGPEAADELARELGVQLAHLSAPTETAEGGKPAEAPAEPQGGTVEGGQPNPAPEPVPEEPAQEPAQRGATGRFGARRPAAETVAA